MEFVKKHFPKILCVVILLCMFLPFVTFYVQAVINGEAVGDKEFGATAKIRFGFRLSGLVLDCALAILICEFLHKHKITLLFSVLGFIFLLISPNFVYKDFLQRLKTDGAVIENEMIFGDGIWHKVIMHRSAAFVIMLICYILLILISLVRIGLSSNASTSSSSDSTDDSKVDLNK